MSTCISIQGEYGEHVPSDVDEFTCGRCFVFDEAAALAEIARLREVIASFQREGK